MSVKSKILEQLEARKGEYLSGGDLAGRLQVSRNAIWKAVQELRREGYPVLAVTNKGYCLHEESDRLSAQGIRPFLRDAGMAERIHVYQTVDSTNLTAKKFALEGAAHGTCVLAESQTAGRGRLGRQFASPAGKGVYLSMVLRPQASLAESVFITTAASVAVACAIESVAEVRVGIKWINDLFVGDKKVCGILTEGATDFESGMLEYLVLGIGVNVSEAEEDFPEGVREVAGTIQDGGFISRNRLAAEIINQVLAVFEELPSRAFLPEYRARSIVLGKTIRISGQGREPCIAKAVEVDENGHLLCEDSAGCRFSLQSGEVSVRLCGEGAP